MFKICITYRSIKRSELDDSQCCEEIGGDEKITCRIYETLEQCETFVRSFEDGTKSIARQVIKKRIIKFKPLDVFF